MIRHIVLIKFQPDFPEEKIRELFAELLVIRSQVPGILGITSGRSESPEKIERGYMHGFVVDFEDWGALENYQNHPDHKALGAKLVANATGGLDGILVVDIPVEA
ncbi:Dabb family protein [Hoeflea prorocentri]|uniref:Dabb family protein n=1 Tax=Hoeflea prorocentri TaxID=1922333 RepID=A0A9X3UJ29_9HYPH|nr:Dabb family protein [Hoeflea prorocentri]MCY6382293.1 Dabb family protein [Hoeflea prorocentri]MDA5400093.1 Dabb family protein [Hoeflea prorocentri]